MEKNTTFKGIINGEEFNNVEAYNEKLNELIKKGVDINASSSTSIKGGNCDCKNENDCNCGGNCKCNNECEVETQEVKPNLLPGFSNPDRHYIGELIKGGDEDVIETNINDLEHYCDIELCKINKHINKMTLQELEEYSKDVTKVRTLIKSDADDMEKEFEALRQKSVIVAASQDIADIYNDLYKNINDKINAKINSLKNPSNNQQVKYNNDFISFLQSILDEC